jgi:glycolate oxidase FAD binding subunit
MNAARVLARTLPEEAVREGGPSVGGVAPEATVTPTSPDQVVEVLRAASADGFGVVPLGGGTDLGPVPPDGPFVLLSTAGLAGVEDYEPADLTLSAWAGTTLEELDEVTAPHRQWLPFDPPLAPRRTLGGLAATGVRGPLCASYGAPRDHILGLTMVTGDGRVLRLGGRVMKNVAGFDLVKLAVGSRGTLGVVLSVNVRLFPRPERETALVLRADSAAELVSAAQAVATAPVVPASAVLCVGLPASVAANSRGDEGAFVPVLVLRLHGAPESVAADAARLGGHVGRAFEVVEGADAAALFVAQRDHAAVEDVVVRLTALPDRLGEVLAGAASLGERVDVAADVLAGRVRAGTTQIASEPLEALRRTMSRLGGSCVVERGPAALAGEPSSGASPAAGVLAARLAERFDPGGVLWPGRKVG